MVSWPLDPFPFHHSCCAPKGVLTFPLALGATPERQVEGRLRGVGEPRRSVVRRRAQRLEDAVTFALRGDVSLGALRLGLGLA